MCSLFTLAAIAALSTAAAAQSPLTTLLAANNGGAAGGAVYFDLTVNLPVTINELKLNCNGGTATNVEIHVVPGGTYVGNEGGGAAFWGAPASTGTITAINPRDTLSDCPVTPLPLSPGTYAVAIVNGAGHAYTNGTGANQQFSTVEMTLDAGSGSNVPFATPTFNPRVWNGEIVYTSGASGTIGTATQSGTGCGGSPFGDGSLYELFAGGVDLAPGFTLTWNGSGYDYANGAGAIVAPTGAGTLAFGDDDTQEIALGFALPSPAGNNSSVWVCSNGFISFEATTNADFSESIQEFLDAESRLCPLWDDLNPSAGGTVDAETVGGDFVVTFTDVPEFGTTNLNNFQVVFSPNGNIEVRYGQVDSVDHLVGVTTGNLATDPGATDLSAAAPFSITTGQFAPTFDIVPGNRPVIGTSASLSIVGELPGSVTAVQYGVPSGGIPLDSAGFPGCFLYVLPITVTPMTSIAIPNNPSLVGVTISAQAASINIGGYPGNVAASSQIDWSIGDL